MTFFADNVVIEVENPRESTNMWLELRREFSNFAEYEANIQKLKKVSSIPIY